MSRVANMVVMAPGDNVGIATRDIAAGECAQALRGREQAALERIAQGHKIALVDIEPDTLIVRYGVPVGVAIARVAVGDMKNDLLISVAKPRRMTSVTNARRKRSES